MKLNELSFDLENELGKHIQSVFQSDFLKSLENFLSNKRKGD